MTVFAACGLAIVIVLVVKRENRLRNRTVGDRIADEFYAWQRQTARAR